MSGVRDGAINGNQTARERARYMRDKLYRIIRLGKRGGHAVGYAETGPSEHVALFKLLGDESKALTRPSKTVTM